MKITFSSTHNAFGVKAPKGTLVSLTGTPTQAGDGIYTIGDEGYILIDDGILTDTIYLSIQDEDYTVERGARVAHPTDLSWEVRAGSSVLPYIGKAKSSGGGSSGGGDNTHYKGTTTTALENGSTTNPITINGESYTAVFGDVVVYGYTEFVFDGAQWSEFGRPFDTEPTSGSINAVTSDGVYRKTAGQKYYVDDVFKGEIFNDYDNNIASGRYSHAEGTHTIASGDCSHAEGYKTIATNFGSMAIGRLNVADTDKVHLLIVGNGTSDSNRSNILEVSETDVNVNGDIRKNGVSLPTPYTTMPAITSNMLGQIAQYVGATDANFTKGCFYIASSDGATEPTYSWVNLLDTTPTSGSANAVTSDGIYLNTAGMREFVNGTLKGEIFNVYSGSIKNVASGTASHAEGSNTTASGEYSHAEGNHTTASGNVSHAEGAYATASGSGSHAGGNHTIANKAASTAIGKYNVADTDKVHLLIVGNGTDEQNRSNIFEVSETDVNVNGDLQINNVALPTPYLTMPTVTESMVGKFALYLGSTTADYTKGKLYEAVSDGSTYSWQAIN